MTEAAQKQLKVLHVITSLERGGAQTVLVRLVGALGSSCHHTVVCLKGEDNYSGVLRSRGVEVICIGMRSAGSALSGLRALVKLMRRVRPDVVQTWMYHSDLLGGLAARFAGIRAIAWGIRNSDLDPERTKGSTRMIVRVCAMLSTWVPTIIVSCSQRARDVHVALGYRQDKFVVIPNGYDLSSFHSCPEARKSLRAEWNVDNDAPLIGMVARWDPQKDHTTFLAAATRVLSSRPAAKFVLIGPEITDSNAQLKALIEAQGLRERVSLLGLRADIPEVMSALDVHVLSSAYGEAFPNVVAESMACGTPCVVTDVGDAAYIVGNKEWVAPPGDGAALAGAVENALSQVSSSRDSLAQRCRERIRGHFLISDMAERFFSTWKQAA